MVYGLNLVVERKKKMIPKVKAYINSKVSAAKTRFETEEMLEVKFKVTTTIWKREDPENTWFGFKYQAEGMVKAITYKIQIPFIEKKTGTNQFDIKTVYDEMRSYRFFFHIFKSMMLNTEIGMNFEQIMANYMVVGQLPDGTPVNVMDKVNELIINPDRPALELLS